MQTERGQTARIVEETGKTAARWDRHKKTCHINWVAHKRRKIFTEFCEPMVWQALLQADVCTLVENNFLQ